MREVKIKHVRGDSGIIEHYTIDCGEDGCTGWQRLVGGRCVMPIVSFGEKVHYRELELRNKGRMNNKE